MTEKASKPRQRGNAASIDLPVCLCSCSRQIQVECLQLVGLSPVSMSCCNVWQAEAAETQGCGINLFRLARGGLAFKAWQSGRLPHFWDLRFGIRKTTHSLPEASTTGVRNHRDQESKPLGVPTVVIQYVLLMAHSSRETKN